MADVKQQETIDTGEVLLQIWLIINNFNKTILLEKLIESNLKSFHDLKKISPSTIFKIVSSIDWDKEISDPKIKKAFVIKLDQLRGTATTTFDLIQLISTINWDNTDKTTLQQQCFDVLSKSLQKQEATIKSLNQQLTSVRDRSSATQTQLTKMRNAIQVAQNSLNAAIQPPPPQYQQYNNNSANYQLQQWKCAVCTYQNTNNSSGTCGMCGLGRSVGYQQQWHQQYQPQQQHQQQWHPQPQNNAMNMNQFQSAPPSAHSMPRSNFNSVPKSMASMSHCVSNYNAAPINTFKMSNEMQSAPKMDPNIGFAVGGANDVNTFRDGILKNKQIPKLNDITFEGIYYDYYFDTNANEIGNEIKDDEETTAAKPIFYPSYCCAKSRIPTSLLMAKHVKDAVKVTNDMIADDDTDGVFNFKIKEEEMVNQHFLTIGLNSNIKESDFSRKKLNLVMVLDISGSMNSTFNRKGTHSKIKTARECILSLLTHLNSDDRFGLVLFDHNVETKMAFKEMRKHSIHDFESILSINARGGTNFEKGFNAGLQMFDQCGMDTNIKEYENRMIFATDACPNIGKTNPESLMNLVKKASNRKDENKRMYTTFVGIGLDFNSNLIAEITKVRGANYFAVKSSADFFKKLDVEFDYFVSPMVFNLKLLLQSEGGNVVIDKVYGSNNIDTKNGEIMKIDTLFPSPPSDSGEIKGGIVLIKLKKQQNNKYDDLFVECSFEDKFGETFKNSQYVKFGVGTEKGDYFTNLGVRKGILLTRYVLLMKAWIKASGSGALKVDERYREVFKTFKKYFKNEMKSCNDNTLKQEMDILTKLINIK